MKVLLLFCLSQAIATAACEGAVECFDGDEALELLQHRKTGRYVQTEPKSLAMLLMEHLTTVPDLVIEHKMHIVWLYSLWPSVLASGLPALWTGGVTQALAFAAFWLLLRPCASMVQVLTSSLDPASPASLSVMTGLTPVAMTLAAHFYWCWGLFEMVVRRRPLTQRFLAAACWAAIFLPVPLAQLSLGSLRPNSAMISAVLGEALGAAFFFGLRAAPCWRLIQALNHKSVEGQGARLRDNLTNFWGGCHWPLDHEASKDTAVVKGLPDFSEDEDFKWVR